MKLTKEQKLAVKELRKTADEYAHAFIVAYEKHARARINLSVAQSQEQAAGDESQIACDRSLAAQKRWLESTLGIA